MASISTGDRKPPRAGGARRMSIDFICGSAASAKRAGRERLCCILPWLALTRLSTDGVADASTTGKLPIWPRTTAMSRAL